MRRHLLGLTLASGTVGLLLGLAIEVGVLADSVFVLRFQASAGELAILAGLALIVLSVLAWWLVGRRQSALSRAVARERAAQAESHRRFIHRLNHELKNPLTAIRAGLANLDDGWGTPARATLGNVRLQVERLGRLADDLRKLADLEVSQMERAPVDVAEIIGEAVEMARSVPGRAERPVSVQELPWSLSPVAGDRDLLLLAIYNVLDNALKFSGPDAEVEMRASEDGAQVTIQVADTGRGITVEDLPHVTEELYRGRGAQGVEGSGLGLALADRVARLHGGELTIRSREGKGTVATFRLPLERV